MSVVEFSVVAVTDSVEMFSPGVVADSTELKVSSESVFSESVSSVSRNIIIKNLYQKMSVDKCFQ